MARTKQRHTYLPYTFPAVAGTHLPTMKGWRVEEAQAQAQAQVQRATGPRLLRDRLRSARLEPRSRDR